MWDERYAQDNYLFGTKPAAFLVAQTDLLQAGQRTLVVADGEGRNSVFLAEQELHSCACSSYLIMLLFAAHRPRLRMNSEGRRPDALSIEAPE